MNPIQTRFARYGLAVRVVRVFQVPVLRTVATMSGDYFSDLLVRLLATGGVLAEGRTLCAALPFF